MNILFFGDVVGRAGRDAIFNHLPRLRSEFELDAVIVSTDNAAGGFGVTPSVAKQFLEAGVDVLTGGDHVWDQRDAPQLLEEEPRLLRPHNFPDGTPGSGCRAFTLKNGKTLLVLHLLGQVFHREYLDSPFACADAALKPYTLGKNVDAILVDMHAEATSEKNAMGVYLDGRVSGVVGSHTHIPTADARILPAGTAYHTDTGMCGNYDSVIGFKPETPLSIFTSKLRKQRMEVATSGGSIAATMISTDDKTGLATRIVPILRGGVFDTSAA